MTKDEYCLKVCHGKCCTLHIGEHRIRCPEQLADDSCGIYKERFDPGEPETKFISLYVIPDKEGCPTVGQFWCWRIEALLAHNQLPEEVRATCCYAHPELLEVHNGTETCYQK